MKLFLLIAAFALTGCADHVSLSDAAARTPVGFWHGVWHGLILPISFIGSLFSAETAIYAVYNTGGWYDFGFILGAGAALGGSSRAA